MHQRLGYGLDEKAIEAVRSWRFNPATDDGRPIKGTAWVELRFTLPEQRPARASDAPVTRPVVPPRLPSVRLRPSTDLEDFLYLIAVNFKAPQVCDRISRSAEGGGGGSSPRGFQISSMRSDCYRSLAWELHDPRLCDQVIAVRTAALDGSKMDKAYCLNGVNGKGWGDIEVPHAWEPFVRYMRLLGYDDARVARTGTTRILRTPRRTAVYERLRTDKTFIERLRTAPEFLRAAIGRQPAAGAGGRVPLPDGRDRYGGRQPVREGVPERDLHRPQLSNEVVAIALLRVDRVQHEERYAVRAAAAHRDIPSHQQPVRFT